MNSGTNGDLALSRDRVDAGESHELCQRAKTLTAVPAFLSLQCHGPARPGHLAQNCAATGGPDEPGHDVFNKNHPFCRSAFHLLARIPIPGDASKRVRRFLSACLGLALIVSTPAHAQRAAVTPEWSVQSLMGALSQVRASAAHFVETKYLHVLNQAQISSGRLTYVAPDRLWKETTEPTSARLTIIGDNLTIERQGERTRAISLREYSEIGALVEAVRATHAGDLPSLSRHFNIGLEGNADRWTLILAPKEARLRELVTTIRIKGEHAAIRDVETTEADGDRTDMAVTPDQR